MYILIHQNNLLWFDGAKGTPVQSMAKIYLNKPTTIPSGYKIKEL